MSTRRIASQHVDISRVALERRPGQVVEDARVPADAEFAALLETGRQRTHPESTGLLQQAILDFVTPQISDPTILRSDRRVEILESLLSDILPHLGDGDASHSRAVKIVGDEISRHRHLLGRIQQGIAA